MIWKVAGAVLIVSGCTCFGLSITAAFVREEQMLRHLIGALDNMQCELQYRMTPLPDLCRQAGMENRDKIGAFFIHLADELESQLSADVQSSVRTALNKTPMLPEHTAKALEIMGASLGRFDADGQLLGLETARSYCRSQLESMSHNREARLRSYQTLGICAGAALAILFV